jgi:type IV secretory pathway VirJ component
MTNPGTRDLAELRTVVARAREQALALTREAKAGRAALQQQRDQLRTQRLKLEAEARTAYRADQLGHEERALMQRIERGETTWQAVASGADDHWTASRVREAVGEQVEVELEELRRDDPEFRAEHDATLLAAEQMKRGNRW